MKWLFLSLLLLVGGALAAFALFTFAWREGGEGAGSEEERGRALAYARQLAEHTSTIEGACSLVGEPERMAPRTWRARIRCASGASPCYAINVEEFEFEGAPRTRCPGN